MYFQSFRLSILKLLLGNFSLSYFVAWGVQSLSVLVSVISILRDKHWHLRKVKPMIVVFSPSLNEQHVRESSLAKVSSEFSIY